MPTDDEGRICSTCGVYIPVGLPVFFRIGNRTLCAECGQKDPLPSDVSMIQQKIADRPLPLPIWRTGQDYWTLTGFEQDVHWAATGVFYALGVIAFIGGWAAASGPAGGWGFAAGAISASIGKTSPALPSPETARPFTLPTAEPSFK